MTEAQERLSAMVIEKEQACCKLRDQLSVMYPIRLFAACHGILCMLTCFCDSRWVVAAQHPPERRLQITREISFSSDHLLDLYLPLFVWGVNSLAARVLCPVSTLAGISELDGHFS